MAEHRHGDVFLRFKTIDSRHLAYAKRLSYHEMMDTLSDTAVLDQLMAPVGQCFTPEVARRIASLRASPLAQARLDELADKCNEGTLTQEEWKLYEACVRTVNFIGVLQAQARAQLAASDG